MKKHSILIVDDEPDLRSAIAFDFQHNDFHVLTAGSGAEALRVLEENRVDIVLSDLRMPNGDGMDLLRKIKARDPFRPVVMLITGFAHITLEEAFEEGAYAVFPKPYDRKLLLEAAQEAARAVEQGTSRRSSRVEVECSLELKVRGQAFPARLVNLGRGGIFVEAASSLPGVSEEVNFHLEAVSSGPKLKMSGKGLVRWVRAEAGSSGPAGCGVEFIELSPGTSRNLVDLINFTKTKSLIPVR